ncbi:unnamed protein product [marine sediment metagenome]|uniref:Uncharacterized protein n=1 Tax=marine sediment metagenome TaxID=412755 RepID=X1UE61_9ZZZZ
MMKKVIEDNHKRPLTEFAQCAVIYLERHPECDEVVHKSKNIIDLDNDTLTSPSLVYTLPEGYEYNFSDVIGVVRTVAFQKKTNPIPSRG